MVTIDEASRTRQPASWRLVGILLAIGGVVAFSIRPLLIKIAYVYAPDPVTLLALRMIFSLPFFLAAAFWVGRRGAMTPLRGRDMVHVAALGFIGYYLASFLDFLGLQYVSAGLGRLILFLYPTVVVLLSAVFLGHRVRPRDVAALVICYAGISLVLSVAIGHNPNLPLGAALVFAGSVMYAVYLVAGTEVIHRVGALRFSAYALVVASLCAIVQFLAVRPLSALALPVEVYVVAFVMATFSTVLPVFMTSEALRRIGANHVAILGALGPVTTVFLGWLGLDEELAPLQILGGVLVLVGVVLVSVKPART
ncbi:MAG: DMT family transporter [Rhodospirillales bacterium]|nr:DMT family transporter [Rhodospirillales bacterium]